MIHHEQRPCAGRRRGRPLHRIKRRQRRSDPLTAPRTRAVSESASPDRRCRGGGGMRPSFFTSRLRTGSKGVARNVTDDGTIECRPMQEIPCYTPVRVASLRAGVKHRSSDEFPEPEIGDEGIVIDVNIHTGCYIIENVRADGNTVWLAEFEADELAVIGNDGAAGA